MNVYTGHNPYVCNTVIKCYYCNAAGCPTWKMINFLDAIEAHVF